jgi:hypothetical protein
MPTECSAESFDFGTVEGRCVEPTFDAGLVMRACAGHRDRNGSLCTDATGRGLR